MDFYTFLMELKLNGTEALNSNDGVIDIILNYMNGQVIALIVMLLN